MFSATGGSVASTTGRARSDSTANSPWSRTWNGPLLSRPPPILRPPPQPRPPWPRRAGTTRGSVPAGDDPLQVGGHARGLVRGAGDGLLRLRGRRALLLDGGGDRALRVHDAAD